MSNNGELRKLTIQATSGELFEADVACDTRIGALAADFFESQKWPQYDEHGRGVRAVVEVVDPNDPDNTKRLNSEWTVGEAPIPDGATLRIIPESAAGTVDPRVRLQALISDHNEMQDLCERDPQISFTANRSHAPDRYEVTLRYTGFKELPPGEREPVRADVHRVEIVLGANYPREAPQLRWLTPIFHPNIEPPPKGGVCIGELRERYLPGMGLARLVRMLTDMVQYRNFNPLHGVNPTAVEWVRDFNNVPMIAAIGGYPLQGPLEQIRQKLERSQRIPVTFKPV
jgi:ubiquitin-protein ligase